MNDITTVEFAIEALQAQCFAGTCTTSEARKYLAEFGGIPHTGKAEEELFLFVGLTYDVEVITSAIAPERCILWKVISPD
jgi:hypothetical protein